MNKPRRIRRFLKWAGVAASVLMVAAWWYSLRQGVGCNIVALGCFWISSGMMGWSPSPSSHGQGLVFEPAHYDDRFPADIAFAENNGECGVAIWLALAVLVGLTILLFFIDRRRIPPGHCRKCGYNLTGNVSGRCPECGKELLDGVVR